MCTPRRNESFTAWFKRLGIRNFSADEFVTYFNVTRRGVTNEAPPPAMWQNIVPTIRIVDDLRAHFGRPVVLNSSYRSEDYNRRCGGVRYFRALDISVAGVQPVTVAAYLKQRRADGAFKGGIGTYATFVHIDTRGNNATW
jgi:uncharacterized protein YcbK (DUF882 family)